MKLAEQQRESPSGFETVMERFLKKLDEHGETVEQSLKERTPVRESFATFTTDYSVPVLTITRVL